MHFGKKIKNFNAPGGLIKLDYKRLKRFIKNGDFELFPKALENEISTLKDCINLFTGEIERQIAHLQHHMVDNIQLLKKSQLNILAQRLRLPENGLSQREILSILRSSKLNDNSAIFIISDLFNSLLAYLDISLCGFRKIVKKYFKRHNVNHTVPSHRDIANWVRVKRLRYTITSMQGEVFFNSEELANYI